MASAVAKAGRKSTAQMKPAAQTREQLISAWIAGGQTNDQVWSAFEVMHPELIKPDDMRRQAGLVKVPYDADERARLGRAIRSTRGILQKGARDTEELLEVIGRGESRPATELEYENIARWSSGDPDMDAIYGHTNYVWLLPKEFREDKPSENGGIKYKINPATGKGWQYGDEIPARMRRHLNPKTGLFDEKVKSDLPPGTAFGDKTGYVEVGIPVSFVSAWGGMRGIGKSKLSLELEKAVCGLYPNDTVIHNFGESNLSQLRQWIGPKAPDNLIVGERKTLAGIIADIYKYKPRLYVQDSLQTIIDAETSSGMKSTLGTLKQLCTEEAAGKPHIILISQLNKKGDLKGLSDIGHIVDAVALLTKKEGGRRNTFTFKMDKNRGGESGGGAQYQHTDDGLVCLGTGRRPDIKLEQKNPVLAAGVVDPVVENEDEDAE
jgi:hypothetical protein